MYRYTTRITLRDADAAGVLFFARYFALAHDAYETMLSERGCSTAEILAGKAFVAPVVRAEADYKAPLRVGELAALELHLEELRSRTYRLRTELLNQDGKLACIIRTTHCSVSTATKRPIAIPEPLRRALESLRDDAPSDSADSS